MSSSEDIELIDSFVVESLEMLDEVEPIFVELTTADSLEMNAEAIGAAFRLYHSIKGASSFLGFPNVTGITHTAETLLGMLRSGDIAVGSQFVEAQLETIDVLREIFEQIRDVRNDDGRDAVREHIVARLEAVMHGESGSAATTAPSVSAAPPAMSAAETDDFSIEPSAEIDVSQVDTDTDADAFPEFLITDEMRQRFCQDSADVLDEAEQALLGLETADEALRATLIAEAFRNLHSFKGNCGFMQLEDMEKLSHKMENVLGAMRDGGVAPDEGNVSVLLKTLDLLKAALAAVQGGGDGSIISCRGMLQFIDEMVLRSAGKPPVPTGAESKERKEPIKPADASVKTPTPVVASDATSPVVSAEAPNLKTSGPDKQRMAPIADHTAFSGAPTRRTEAVQDVAAPESAVSGGGSATSNKGSIRVDVDKLDTLINLVGELIIAEAMVLRNPTLLAIEDETLDRGIHQLRRVSSDLQDIAMAVRMIPLAATFRRMIRLVHDTARKSGKRAALELIGEDTEVDKNVIEQIGDPLVHIIRNSVDHGIEPAEEREALGKPAEGRITIEGRHEGGEVWIMIRDDGRGLNRAKIIAKAIERNLIKGKPEELGDEDIFGLIFQAGFSTADTITDVSGRGVGMDVVKKNVEKLNGKVRVKSVAGKGTEVILQIPLTMAIIDGMLVRVGTGRYTLPLLSIRECIPHPARKQVTVTPDGAESVMIRGELIPVLRLHDVFKKKGANEDLSKGILVVVQSGDEPVALLVDELIGQQETVIKGLSPYLGDARGISGCTVLGDGEVSLIVDVESLVRMRAGGDRHAD
jgi:two-component system chemotaxis sensor kinase CheA